MTKKQWVICPPDGVVPIRKKTLPDGKVIYINRDIGEPIETNDHH